MPDGRLDRLLTRFIDVRPNEAGRAIGLFLYFFLVTLSIYVVKPVKENYLIGITPAWWPYADFITAALIGFVVAINARLLKRLPQRRYFAYTTIFFIPIILALWFIFEVKLHSGAFAFLGFIPIAIEGVWPAPVFVFCFWFDVFVVMTVVHFWFAVNDLFNIHQAKKLVSFFVSGGILGGIAGSTLASQLVHRLGPANLMLICPIILLLNLRIINYLYADQRQILRFNRSGKTEPSYFGSLRIMKKDRYLRILGILFGLVIVLEGLVNYQFKIAIKDAIPNDASRTAFIGSFFLGVLLLSAIFHLFTTGQLLKRFGIRTGLLVGPIFLLLGSIVVFIAPSAGLVLWACVMRGSDKTYDYTVGQSVRELLYMPVSPSIKYEAKIFIDMFVSKIALAFGATLFWILYRSFSFAARPAISQVRLIGAFVIALSIICAALIWKIYAEYLAVVRSDLTRKWQDAHKVLPGHVDLDESRLIIDTIQSRERSSTLYAMNLFQLIQKEKLSPELLAYLGFKEDEMEAHSIDSLFDVPGTPSFQNIEETVADKDFAAMIQRIVSLDSYQRVMEKRLDELVNSEDASEVERMEASRLIGILKPTPAVRRCLGRMLQDSSSRVLIYALDSAAVHRLAENVSKIIPLLGNPLIAPVAQDALATYGSGIEDSLGSHLNDTEETVEVRKAIPEVLARLESQKAADILSGTLMHGSGDVQESVIAALYKMRATQSGIHFRKKWIIRAVYSLIAKCYALYLARTQDVVPGKSPENFQDSEQNLHLSIKQLFDLLALIYPAEDMVLAYQNILQGASRSVDYSLELLDNILDRKLKLFLLPLIEDIPEYEKDRRIRRLAKNLNVDILKTGGSSTPP